MKIFAFALNTTATDLDIEQRLHEILVRPLLDRNMLLNKEHYRVEAIQKIRDFWCLDFIKIRMDHGPGKGGLTSHVQPFNLGNDEGFCEETAVLIHPQSKVMAVQYNHHGPRVGAIAEYIAFFDPAVPMMLQPTPYLDNLVEQQLVNKRIFSKFQMTFERTAFTAAEYAANSSLARAAQCAASLEGDRINIEVSVTGRDNTLGQQTLDIATLVLQKMRGMEEVAISSAKLSAKENIDDRLEVLDLVAQRVYSKQTVATGPDRRYPQGARWDALQRAYAGWLRDGALR